MVKNTQTDAPIHSPEFSDRESEQDDFLLWRRAFDRLLNRADNFHAMSLDAAHYLHRQLTDPELGLRDLADLLHGKGLGHPLHPILTDLTVGSWSLAFFFDLLSILPGTGDVKRFADVLTVIGTTTAIPTSLSGLTDYSTIKRSAASYGAAHGMLNGAAFICYMRSTIARVTGGSRSTALFYALLGVTLITVSAWLGGDLVYRHRVGVNHVPQSDVPTWTPVLALDDLNAGEPVRVEANRVPVLLFRQGDEVFAINAVCSHAGGPLDEGRVVNEVCIECPWHQSLFDMRDGDVVHAPATYAQPHYHVRIHDGQIEIRSDKYQEEV